MNITLLLTVLLLAYIEGYHALAFRRFTRGSRRAGILRRLRRQPLSVQDVPEDKAPKALKTIRMQPRPQNVERKLKERYAAIDGVEDRAYQILVDLGMADGGPKGDEQ